VVIHPLTDDRRRIRIDKTGEVLQAPPEFLLVISYNPGYQTVLKDLKPSTKQRFIGLTFDFPSPEVEKKIIMNEVPGTPADIAAKLVATGNKARGLRDHGLDEVTSTRALVYAANLIVAGLPAVDACRAAMVNPITDDIELSAALSEIVSAHFD
jgi:nitric oxide reductase NorQ protein